MKLELKTENENYPKFLPKFLGIVFILAIIIILCDISLKLKIISKHYEISTKCRLLAVRKSTINFKTLSKLSNLKSKQRILEFCRENVK